MQYLTGGLVRVGVGGRGSDSEGQVDRDRDGPQKRTPRGPARIAGSIVRNQLAPSWALGESTGSLPAAGLADDLLEL